MNVLEDLKAYVDGELSAERREAIDAAMERDERLRRELEEIRVLSRLIGDCVVEPEPIGMERTLARLERTSHRPSIFRLFADPLRFAWLYATVLLIVAASALPISRLVGAGPGGALALSQAGEESATATAAAPEQDKAAPSPAAAKSEVPAESSAGTIRLREQPRTTFGSSAGGGFSDAAAGKAAAPKPPARLEGPSAPDRSGASPTIARRAKLTLEVASVTTAQAQAAGAARDLGGYLEWARMPGPASAKLSIRVPQSRFDEGVRRIRALGKLRAVAQSAEDVAPQVKEAEGQLNAGVAARKGWVTPESNSTRYLSNGSIEDLDLGVEALKHKADALRGQAAYSTIDIDLEVAPPPEPATNAALEKARAAGLNLLILAPLGVPVVLLLWWFGRRRLR